MNIPHFRIPKSLTHDPLWSKLTAKQKIVMFTILDHVCFKPQKFNDSGVVIDLEPGQLCITIRRLIELCGDDFSKNDIERSLQKLIKFNFMRQDIRHKKTVLTVTHLDTCKLCHWERQEMRQEMRQENNDLNDCESEPCKDKKNQNETGNETGNETIVRHKEEGVISASKKARASLDSLNASEKEETLRDAVNSLDLFISEEDVTKWIKRYGVKKVHMTLDLCLKRKLHEKANPSAYIQKALKDNYLNENEGEI